MKLRKIQLSGFKSFPEPTVIDIDSDMVGIVGPNGCGKSNIVDAIRWVMGETSRHIRAASLDDVIFSGTNARKPLGRASVELVFDNADGSIGGQYAQYAELIIKRVVARDSESKYYINNTHCRRKDIAELFFGTGLSANNYAIIEQGMITRLVESKPEEMRGYIEEAAGVSRYKNRRRDTENRIRHTRDNLSRVLDIREELDKQLRKLKRQVREAERFREIRLEKSKLEAELLLLKLRDYDAERQRYEKSLSDQRVDLEHNQTDIRSLEADAERQRTELDAANDQLNARKEAGYRLDAEIAGLEQDLGNRQTSMEQMQTEKQETQALLVQNQTEIETEKQKQLEFAQAESECGKRIEQMISDVADLQKQISEREAELVEVNALRDRHHSESRESTETLKVENARAEMYAQALADLRQNETDIDRQMKTLNAEKAELEQSDLPQRLAEHQELARAEQTRLRGCTADLQNLQTEINTLNERLNRERGRLQEMQGQIASLQAFQEARLGHDTEAFHQWIEKAGLARDCLIAEAIEVSDGWGHAVETVLESFLEGVRVDALEDQVSRLNEFNQGNLVLVASDGDVDDADAPSGTLASMVSGGKGLVGFLRQIKLADSVEDAMAIRDASLQAHESVVTRDGVWVGKNWIKMHKMKKGEEGVLDRKHKIESLTRQLEQLGREAAATQNALEAAGRKVAEQEKQRDTHQTRHTDLLKQIASLESGIAHLDQNLDNRRARLSELEQKRAETTRKRQQIMDDQSQSQQEKVKAEQQVSAFNTRHSDIEKRRADSEKQIAELRDKLETRQSELHRTEIKKESSYVAHQAAVKHGEQLQKREVELRKRLQSLSAALNNAQNPLGELTQRKEALVKEQFAERKKLDDANARIVTLQKRSEETNQNLQEKNQQCENLRTAYEQTRTDLQVSAARCSDINEAYEKLDADRATVEAGISEDMTIASHEEALQSVEKKLERLGAINLAALDEFNELTERSEFIQTQYEDLTSALEILENTIKKIDQETKAQFKDTFEQINLNLQRIFPALFGGGEAYLEMTERDLLKTGITIMAKPPGKRLVSINLMSGGEKALTAAAVVFSIFELNPSPFCVLDEVDAPLDEHNVERFCEMLKTMSDRVQFVMITHNKTSMEYTDNLLGITMQEAGVSRLVSVNMDEAVRLASA